MATGLVGWCGEEQGIMCRFGSKSVGLDGLGSSGNVESDGAVHEPPRLQWRPAGKKGHAMHCERQWEGATAQAASQVVPPFGPGVGADARWVARLEIWTADPTDTESCTEYRVYDVFGDCRVTYRVRPALDPSPPWIDWVDALNDIAGQALVTVALCAACGRLFPAAAQAPQAVCPTCRQPRGRRPPSCGSSVAG